MFHNRISDFLNEDEGETIRPEVAAPDANSTQSPTIPMFVRPMDLYQAAHAKAVHDHQIDKLFNPDVDF